MPLFIILSLLCLFLLLVVLGRKIFSQNKQITVLQTQLEDQIILLQNLQDDQQQSNINMTVCQQGHAELSSSTKQSLEKLAEKLQSLTKTTSVLQNEVEILTKQKPESLLR